MSLVMLENVQRHYGAQEVLRGVTAQIDPGEKVGLVGRNGGGKTTLLRLIEGLEKPDAGRITIRKGTSLGHVPQTPHFPPGVTIRAWVEGGMKLARELAEDLARVTESLHHLAGPELERAIHEHESLEQRLRMCGGYEIDRRVETVLSGIGLARELWDREAQFASGGEKSRTALARELVAGHDLLLLDEPTNHLDLEGIEWMEGWLAGLAGAVLVVSHDRRMLDRAVDTIFDLERGKLSLYRGNYTKYVELRELKFLTDQRAFDEQQDFLRKEEDFIRRNMGSQRTAEAKGRQKKLENLVRVQQPFNDVRRPVIHPPKAARGGELVLDAHDLEAGFGERTLFRGVDLRIGRGQRIGIVGPNGSGKSTLLKILAGRLAPRRGAIERGHKSACGYYDQDAADLPKTSSPYLEIRREHPAKTDLEIRSHLARFLFRGTEIDKPVSALSGGERARVALAKLVLTEPSWLALDEPTNHLDLAARAALEEMLSEFDGAMVAISHDRAFLDGLCTHVIEVADGAVRQFAGNYSEYRARKAAERGETEAAAKVAKQRETKVVEAPPPPTPKPKSAPGKVRNPYMFQKLEARIIALEEELAQLREKLVSPEVYRDGARVRELQLDVAEREAELERANEEWANWG
ncbi:MAG TPA: ABC-F family ATP-binding cassette domain-containing protein [Planctomycetota bacterium]|nr:ABC-F family ATP-binding cassette domain-containing protein [Planctomycetota bacterium]